MIIHDPPQVLVALASHQGVASAHQITADLQQHGATLSSVYGALHALALRQLVSHSGLEAECRAVSRCFKSWHLNPRIPDAKGVAFCLTTQGIEALKKTAKASAK
jgi:Fe2+ or Zn2+ uptake regulation protein